MVHLFTVINLDQDKKQLQSSKLTLIELQLKLFELQVNIPIIFISFTLSIFVKYPYIKEDFFGKLVNKYIEVHQTKSKDIVISL